MTATTASQIKGPPVFAGSIRRARRLSIFGSLGGHLGLIALLVYSMAGMLGKPSTGTGIQLGVIEDQAETKEEPYLEMVEVTQPKNLPRVPKGIDPKLYQKFMKMGIIDTKKLSPEELAKKLKEFVSKGANTSDTSLANIGRFLGMNPNRYKVRIYYKDELNPNIHFLRAEIIRAYRYQTDQGEAGYTITLQDTEKDAFTFTLEGKAANELETSGVTFGEKTLTKGKKKDVASLELKGAKIKDIGRWKRPEDPVGMRGATVILQGPKGEERSIHIEEQEHPLKIARMAYGRNYKGKLTWDPDDETTVFTQLVDNRTLTLWKAEEAESKKPNEKRAKVTMLDSKGNRLIYFETGKAAEETLSLFGKVTDNSTLNRIYQKTGMPGYLHDLLNQQSKPTPPTPKPKDTK